MATTKPTQSVPTEQLGVAEDVMQILPTENTAVDNNEPMAEVAPPEQPQKQRPKQAVIQAVDISENELEAVEAPSVVKSAVVDNEEEDASGSGEVVDFSEEDAQLAGDAPEFDLGEQAEHESEQETEGADSSQDLAGKSKPQLLDMFAQMLEAKPVQGLRKDAEAIKIAFYKLHRVEVEQIRKVFADAGGNLEEFVAPVDTTEVRLKELFNDYRHKRDEFIATLEHKKEDNLHVKLRIIEELKELINSGETLNHTFNAFRELQQHWKETGLVPQANIKDLWETYNLHVENFYNFIKINKELRDLDLKRNYEAKLALCEQAEALVLEPSVINAFHRLQKLHEQWRETGPVANEYKETLWERFKEASSRINKQHQDYFETIKDDQKRNYDLKSELCVKTEELLSGMLTSRKEWNKASDQLIEIQKVWKTIGFAPKKENAKVYERFRNACDKFFEQKRNFYLQVKAEMEHNMQLKNEICMLAESLRESHDWKKTTDELILLQKQWKEIGPVSRRHSDVIWKRFRAACDSFFETKSKHFSSVDSEHDQNLQRKRELLAEIEACDILEGGFEAIKNFQRRWSEIGFVPIKQKDAVGGKYKELMDKLFAALRGSDRDRQMDRFKGKVASLKGGGDRRLKFERERLYNKVKQLEADIALLENNIGFFSKSKNAEAMIRDVKAKIEHAKQEMTATIEKVNLIDKQQ